MGHYPPGYPSFHRHVRSKAPFAYDPALDADEATNRADTKAKIHAVPERREDEEVAVDEVRQGGFASGLGFLDVFGCIVRG